MKLEICTNSFESAQAAQQGGADRIELCVDLAVGGLTPSQELIGKVISELSIPAHVLIRPRTGNFNYSSIELDQMLNDISYCRKLGCAGIVSGVLTKNNEIDEAATKKLILASEGIEFTFHRAFDMVPDPINGLKTLMKLGVTRLLSSGQKAKAIDGLEMLKELKSISEGKIEIMPGSGINGKNAQEFKLAGFKSLHTSAILRSEQTSAASFFDTGIDGTSDLGMIKEIVKILA